MTPISIKPYEIHENKSYNNDVLIQIKKSDFTDINYRAGQITLSVSSCLFKKVIIENTEEIDFTDISLSFGCCYIESIEIKNITSKNISILFLSSIVSGKIESIDLGSIQLNNCFIPNGLFFIGIQKVQVTFSKENIFPYRWKNLLKNIIDIKNYRKYIGSSQSYYIYGCKKVDFRSNSKVEDKRDRFNVNLSLMYNEDNVDSYTQINDTYLQSLSFRGNPKGKISVENTKVGDWYIYDFSPKEEVSFYNINPTRNLIGHAKIGIHKCKLDNAWFDNVNFDEYSLISFYRTKFSETIFTSCNFPEKYVKFEKFSPIENVHYPNSKNDNYDKDQYEIFLQLKKSLESTGNYFEAQKLQAISHDALKKIKNLPTGDKIILWISSKSNKHGLAIKEPLIGFMLFTVVFYILYLWSLGRIFNTNGINWKLFGYYFSFIDITHRTDFMVEKNEFNGLSLLFDYVNKVVASFFIYQFIAAFRKYGKK